MTGLPIHEAIININGVQLTPAQSMTLRVAVANFLYDMSDPDHLGKDDHGRAMVQGYRARASEVQEYIFLNLNKPEPKAKKYNHECRKEDIRELDFDGSYCTKCGKPSA